MASEGHGFEALRAHHRAHPRATGGGAVVAHHRREFDQILARRADAGHSDFFVAQLLPDEGLSLVGAFAPEMGGSAEFGASILDAEIYRLRRLAFDDDAIVAGKAHLRPEEAAGIGLAPEVGQGRAGADHEAAAGGGAGARERAGHEEQWILRPQRIGISVHHVVDIAAGQAASADETADVVFVQGFVLDFAIGQVNDQQFAHVAVHGALLQGWGNKSTGQRGPH